MRTENQMQALEKLPNESMAKKIILKILNTPKPNYDAMKIKSKEYEAQLIEEMPEKDKIKLMEINSLLWLKFQLQDLNIYALPENNLINYYQSLGFSRLSPEEEDFVHQHVKPSYDEGCYFMYQII